ncbi:hypothetical protein KCP77_11695 [Salmonella enterica subsp. enterica]|nr:hypothetical protein KCP77_11695 [Salmonella enterica subsp. enterica]
MSGLRTIPERRGRQPLRCGGASVDNRAAARLRGLSPDRPDRLGIGSCSPYGQIA